MKKAFLYGICMFLLASAVAQPATIHLSCANRKTNANYLQWVPPSPSCPGFSSYDIYGAQSLAGPYSLIASITNPATNNYYHNGVANNTWYYYITQTCNGSTSAPSDTLDTDVPVTPVIEAVSIENGAPYIWWHNSPSPETQAYVVFVERPVGSNFDQAIDTVWHDTSFTHTSSQSSQHSEQYRIAAMDDCLELGLKSVPHKTTYLSETTNHCTGTISLQWTLYEGWPQGIARQELWLAKNGQPEVRIDTLSDTTTHYTYHSVPGDSLCFFIKSIRGDRRVYSKSNRLCFVPRVNHPVKFIYLKNITLTPNGQTELQWYWNSDADLQSGTIYKSGTVAGTVSPPPVFDNTFTDPGINAENPWYHLAAADSCGNITVSDSIRTILLNGYNTGNFESTLNWSAYNIPNGTVLNYEIHRITTTGDHLVGTIPSQGFIDHLDGLDESQQSACYYIIANVYMAYPDGRSERVQSYSNKICLRHNAVIWLPNAFAPGDGVNKIYKAIAAFRHAGPFRMEIYNRWGDLIFHSDTIETGWDGTLPDGKPAPGGAYACIVHYYQPDGTEAVEKSPVILIR